MPRPKIPFRLSTRRSIYTALSFALGLFAVAPPADRAQQSEAEVGIIVVKSADQAKQVVADLKAGMDFRVIAKERSVDSTAADGGSMGRLNPDSLRPEFRDALKGLKPGRVTGVIPFRDRFAVLTIFPAPSNPGTPRESGLPAGPPPVRNMIGIDGFNEADDAFQQFPQKPDGWERSPELICSIRQQSVPHAVTAVEKLLSEAEGPSPNPSAPLEESDALVAIEAHTTLAQLHAYNSEMDKAVKEFQTAYQYAVASSPRSLPFLNEALGVTYRFTSRR